jgi:phosphocarrier protein
LVETQLVIRNQLGLHARACALFVKKAAQYKAQVMVSRDDLEVNGKSIMGVMMLAAGKGAKVLVEIDGPDETAAMDAIVALIGDYFGEGQ